MNEPLCLNCGASIYAEDGGLCPSCAAEVHGPEPEPERCKRSHTNDPRFNAGFVFEVLNVLDKHGFRRAEEPQHLARSLVRLLHLVEAYEGKESPDGH